MTEKVELYWEVGREGKLPGLLTACDGPRELLDEWEGEHWGQRPILQKPATLTGIRVEAPLKSSVGATLWGRFLVKVQQDGSHIDEVVIDLSSSTGPIWGKDCWAHLRKGLTLTVSLERAPLNVQKRPPPFEWIAVTLSLQVRDPLGERKQPVVVGDGWSDDPLDLGRLRL